MLLPQGIVAAALLPIAESLAARRTDDLTGRVIPAPRSASVEGVTARAGEARRHPLGAR